MKINVIGTSGSGKSTFARRLAAQLNAPYVELDRLFWLPNWAEPTDDVFFSKLEEALDQPQWVLDGNYSRTNPIKWRNVNLVVWLDYSFTTTVWQAVRRAVRRSWTGEELWPGTGNRETFRGSFLNRKSIIVWTINQHGPSREKNLRIIEESKVLDSKYGHIKFVRLRSHKDAERFLLQL